MTKEIISDILAQLKDLAENMKRDKLEPLDKNALITLSKIGLAASMLGLESLNAERRREQLAELDIPEFRFSDDERKLHSATGEVAETPPCYTSPTLNQVKCEIVTFDGEQGEFCSICKNAYYSTLCSHRVGQLYEATVAEQAKETSNAE